MALIQIENLTFSYYSMEKPIFDNISFSFDTNWKTGLIGRNGIGKSTFIKLFTGNEKFSGNINTSVKFFNFPPNDIDKSKTVIEIFRVYNPVGEDWQLFRELSLLNVDEDIDNRVFNTLSKGEQTKVLLAILFTIDDAYFLIDEPTNHLDIDGRRVVSEFLRKKRQGFLIISHDRDFLDGCINHIISFNKTTIDVQSGNFTSWYNNKMDKDNFEFSENEKLKKDIKRLKDAATQRKDWSDILEKRKNGVRISGNKPDKGRIGHQAAKMMKSSKNIEKRMQKNIEDKEKLLKDVEKIEELPIFSLDYPKKKLLEVRNLQFSYEDRKILEDINFSVNKGDRVAIIGKNGSGKSSLLKILMGSIKNYSGELNFASNLKISYVRQDIDTLKGVLNDYIDSYEDIDKALFRTTIMKLGFNKDLFNANIENFSEGQKKKVLLALSLCNPTHIYIWDEPLNYLDIISRIQIEEVILKFNPTMIFVEHDRKFIDSVATKLIEL